MAEFKIGRLDGQPPRIRNVPIAVTPEGFWCCPSQAALQRTAKSPNQQGRPRGGASPAPSKASSVQRAPTVSSERRPQSTPTRSRTNSDEQVCPPADAVAAPDPPKVVPVPAPEKRPKQHKISVGFGQLGTSDLKVVLHGKEGVAVKMIVHKNILAENSTFFADRISRQSPVACIEVPDCEDVEIYVETVGLMYCKDVKHRLIKQNVPRVLRILKVAESLGFRACIMSCLDYLEAVPWVGDEEENVVSSIRQLHDEDHRANPLLRRVTSDVLTNPPNDTLAHIIDLVLKSSEDRGRREMKSLVLKLFKENSSVCANGSSADSSCVMTLYSCFQNCLDSLLALSRQASNPEELVGEESSGNKEQTFRKIALEADNLLWLAEILSDRNAADELTVIWASQAELAELHPKIPVMHRHLVSCGKAAGGNRERRGAANEGDAPAAARRVAAAADGRLQVAAARVPVVRPHRGGGRHWADHPDAAAGGPAGRTARVAGSVPQGRRRVPQPAEGVRGLVEADLRQAVRRAAAWELIVTVVRAALIVQRLLRITVHGAGRGFATHSAATKCQQ